MKNEKDLKAAGIELLASNASMSEVFMAKNGQGFASKHDAEVANAGLGFKGAEGAAYKVVRSGNDKAIAPIVERIEKEDAAAVKKMNEDNAKRSKAVETLAGALAATKKA